MHPAGDARVFYMRAQDLAGAQQVFAVSDLRIDEEIRAIIAECWHTANARPHEVLLELFGPVDIR
jgi:hypothetical protein